MRNIFFLFLFSFPCLSFSADYNWEGYAGSRYSSPTAACQSYEPGFSQMQRDEYELTVTKQTDTQFFCYWAEPEPCVNGCLNSTYNYTYRYGSTCPADTTYNSETGVCEAAIDPCSEKIGTSSNFSKSGSIGDGFFFMTSGGASGTANDGCQSGCGGTISGAKCTVKAGEPGTYTCAGSIYYSGQQCTSSPGDVGTSDSAVPPPAPPTEETDNNCGSWISTADGQSQTCVSTTTKDNPGTADSGTAPTPTPSKSTDDTITVTDKKTNPDGTTTTTTTKTTNNTYCTVGTCTTTTTTNTTVTTSDSGGTVTGSSSSCVGPNCSKPANGTGTGTGSGSGTGGEGDSEVTVTGAYSGTLAAGEQGNFDSANAYWDDKIAESKEQLRTKLDNMKSAVTANTSPTLAGGAGGLPCGEPITFGNGYSIDLCFSPYEGSLEGFKAFILFLAALIAFYIVFVRN